MHRLALVVVCLVTLLSLVPQYPPPAAMVEGAVRSDAAWTEEVAALGGHGSGAAVAGAAVTPAPRQTTATPTPFLGRLKFIQPVRVADTRASAAGRFVPGETRFFLIAGQTFGGVALPIDLTGILVNVTVVGGPAGGYVVVFPGDVAVPPNASTVNPASAIAHNFWATGVAGPTSPTAGSIAVTSSEALDVILDVVGYYALTNTDTLGPLQFITPVRVLDTRSTGNGITTTGFDAATGNQITAGPLAAGSSRGFRLAGKQFTTGGLPSIFPAQVSGIFAHVTAIGGSGGGFVTLLPGDATGTPTTSTLNPVNPVTFNSWAVGLPVAGPDAGSFKVYTSATIDIAVDVLGFYSPNSDPSVSPGTLSLISPVRVVDTRNPSIGFGADGLPIAPGGFSPAPGTAGETRRYSIAGRLFPGGGIPGGIKALLLNVTIVQGGPSGGFVTAFPGAVADTARPSASTVNPSTAVAAAFWANGITVTGTAAGQEAIFSTNALDVVIDIVGYYQ